MKGSAGSAWPTATTEAGLHNRKGASATSGDGLSTAAKAWGTPRASDAEKGGPNQAFGAGGTPLPAQAAQWPTPAARDHKGENSHAHLLNGTGRLHLDQLPNAVAHAWHHPDQVTRTHGLPSSTTRPISRRLFRSAASRLPQIILRRWLRRGAWRNRRLNPAFVSWLMAWPPGHELCACSETAFTRWQRDMRGALSQLPTASGALIWQPPRPLMNRDLGNLFDWGWTT
jgi:hypothetical protein